MFWSGNYIVVRELNFLLKEENVSLSQVLEADDILQECKADNKALLQFLTKPEILSELITLITEEPPKNVELALQYRHANIACEVLTSQLSMLSDRLSLDAVQMNRLCDFLNKDPPLNPLLASYFSKTVEMLLERSPKQDWYLYHIVCLRVLDFFKSRRDFLPNLLRHISTSAIADTFKYFIRLDDLFNKYIMEWLEEHQFLECLIQIICGTYVPEEYLPASGADVPEKGERELSEKTHPNHTDHRDGDNDLPESRKGSVGEAQSPTQAGEAPEDPEEAARRAREARVSAVASANAAALLCELIVNGCAGEGCSSRPRTSWVLVARLQSERMVRALLQSVFTSPLESRSHAVVNGCQVLLALLDQEPILGGSAGTEAERTSVELAVAPHLPLLHHALLHNPHHQQHQHHQTQHQQNQNPPHEQNSDGGGGVNPGSGVGVGCGVGLARVQVAALLAHLALSEVEEVPTTLLTLGTPGVLVEMFFKHSNNNFLHAQVYALVKHALNNRVYRTQYARHLLVECDLLTRLMDVFEENENKKSGSPRAGYMGHVILSLHRIARALEEGDEALMQQVQVQLPPAVLARWPAFRDDKLRPLLHHHDTPLGGYFPPENIYEVENMADTLAAGYDFNDRQFNEMGATATMDDMADDNNADDINEIGGGGLMENPDFIADGLGLNDGEKMVAAQNNFLELASQRFDDDMWDDTPEPDVCGVSDPPPPADLVHHVLGEDSPWESGSGGSSAGEGWAQFGGDLFPPPADPFAPPAPHTTHPTRTHEAPHTQHTQHTAHPTHAPDDPATPHQHPAPTQEQDEFTPFWSYGDDGQNVGDLSSSEVCMRMRSLRLARSSGAELANNLLTAMSGMTPQDIANIVNANTNTNNTNTNTNTDTNTNITHAHPVQCDTEQEVKQTPTEKEHSSTDVKFPSADVNNASPNEVAEVAHPEEVTRPDAEVTRPEVALASPAEDTRQPEGDTSER